MNKYRLGETTRAYAFLDNGVQSSVILRQIVALRDFADVRVGTPGGWVDDETALSQQGNCWIYDENSAVFAGARIHGDARITRPCVISHRADIGDSVWIDGSKIQQRATIRDNVTVRDSQVQGDCLLSGSARVLDGSKIIAVKGMTADASQRLQIYDRATVNRSRIVHQVQIYGNATVSHAFIQHRAEISDFAQLLGNEKNSVWVCDCACVSGHARIIAGDTDDAIPTLRYSTRVSGHAQIEGNCVLRHHVCISGYARLCGGPILLDNNVVVSGHACITGDVVIEHQVEINEHALVTASDGEQILIRGHRVINGSARILRTPLLGAI